MPALLDAAQAKYTRTSVHEGRVRPCSAKVPIARAVISPHFARMGLSLSDNDNRGSPLREPK